MNNHKGCLDLVRHLRNAGDKNKGLKKLVEKGEGTIGLLLNDKEMYNNLTSASKQLDLLIEDMKKHPKRYVTFSLLGGRRTAFEVKKDTTE